MTTLLFPQHNQFWTQDRILIGFKSFPTNEEISFAKSLDEEPIKIYSLLKNKLKSVTVNGNQWDCLYTTDKNAQQAMEVLAGRIDTFLHDGKVLHLHLFRSHYPCLIEGKVSVVQTYDSLPAIYDSPNQSKEFIGINIGISTSQKLVSDQELAEYELSFKSNPSKLIFLNDIYLFFKPVKNNLTIDEMNSIKNKLSIENVLENSDFQNKSIETDPEDVNKEIHDSSIQSDEEKEKNASKCLSTCVVS